jgi:hypothetical protein
MNEETGWKKFASTRLFVTIIGTLVLWAMFRQTVSCLSGLEEGMAAAVNSATFNFLWAVLALWGGYLGSNSWTKVRLKNGQS